MNTARPLLFLDSPNVGSIGHAYVISRNDRPLPGEVELREAANLARSDTPQKEFIAAKRSVVQHDTRRHAEEILICSNAVPAKSEEGDTVRKVLADLLERKIAPDALKSGQLTKQSGLIYSAPCMDEIVTEFHADPRIQMIRWRASTAKVAPPPVPSTLPPKKSRMKWLALLILLAAVPVIQKRKASQDSTVSTKSPSAAPTDTQGANVWAFLTTDDWPRLMEATGGKGALKTLQELQVKLENDARQEETQGLKKFLPGASSSKMSGDAPSANVDPKPALQLVNCWADLFLQEFPDAEANPSQAKELRVKESPVAKILIQARANNDGRSIPSVSGWITDYQNQRKNYSEGIKQRAQSLDGFLSAFPGKTTNEVPGKLRGVWNALEEYGKGKLEPGEDTGFHDLVNRKMRQMTAPSENFTTLTIQDAKRVEVLREILGAPEFGLVLIGSRLGTPQADWSKIRSQIDAVAGGKQHPTDASHLKAALVKQFQD